MCDEKQPIMFNIGSIVFKGDVCHMMYIDEHKMTFLNRNLCGGVTFRIEGDIVNVKSQDTWGNFENQIILTPDQKAQFVELMESLRRRFQESNGRQC